jgi:hypothetical protein
MLSVVMLNIILPSVIILNVIMLNVIMLSVIMLSIVMLSVIMLNFVAPYETLEITQNCFAKFCNFFQIFENISGQGRTKILWMLQPHVNGEKLHPAR